MDIENIVDNSKEFDPTFPYGYQEKYPQMMKDCGEYNPSTSYKMNQVVTIYSSMFESKIDDNTFPPVILDEENNVFIIDTDHWNILKNNLMNYVFACDIKKNEEKAEDLQEQVNAIVNKETTLELSVNNSVIFYGTPTPMIVRSTVDTTGKIGADSHTILRDGNILVASSEANISYSEPITALTDFIYKSSVSINGLNKEKDITVRVVKPIYYGSGSNPNYANIQVPTPKTSPAGTYDVNIASNRSYVFFDFPNGMTPSSFKVSGFDMPMKIVTSGRSGYTCYQSENTYDAGPLRIVIT